MFPVDRMKLDAAFGHSYFDTADKRTGPYWGQRLDDILPQNSFLHTNGDEYSIPISHQDVQCIKNIATCSMCYVMVHQGASASTSSPISRVEENCFLDIAVSAINNIMGLQFTKEEISIEILLNQLTLCTPDGCFHKKALHYMKKPSGTFGKLILQIPVSGGYEGGRLNVGNSDLVGTTFDFQSHNDQHFYAMVCVSDLKHEWQPILKGNMIALEFDLIWRPCPELVISSMSFYDFLSSVTLAEEALSNLNISYQQNEKADQHRTQLDASDSEDSSYYHPLLIIPLNEVYYDTHFNFSSLTGKDRRMVQILQSIDFIDVHLAAIRKEVRNTENSLADESSCQIVQLIYSINSIPQFDLTKIPISQNNSTNIDILSSKMKCSFDDLYSVLIIQPLRQSIHRCCASNFDVMLQHLETRILSEGKSKMMQTRFTTCLKQVLFYCQAEPAKVWNNSDATERTIRLFDICGDLQAQEAGFLLMEIFRKDILKSQQNEVSQRDSDRIARCIINMILKIGDWCQFSPSVLRLISPSRILNQLGFFSTMVVTLVEYGWTKEAKKVAKKICSALLQTKMENIRKNDLNSYVDAIIALNTFAIENGFYLELERLFIPVFRRLSSRQQCCLLIDLHEKNSSRLSNSTSGLNIIYKKMCRLLLCDELCSSVDAVGTIRQVVSCFVRLDDKEILEEFIVHVFWGENFNHLWIQKFLAAADLSTLTLLFTWLKKQVDNVKAQAIEPLVDEDTQKEKLFRSFLNLIRLESIPQLSKYTNLSQFTAVFPDMQIISLISLMENLIQNGAVTIYPSSRLPLLSMARLLLVRFQYVLHRALLVPTICNLLKEFIALPDDTSLLIQLVQAICFKCKWHSAYKILLMKKIFNSSIVESESGIIGRTSQQCWIQLMKSWIVELELRFISQVTDRQILRDNLAACFSVCIKEAKKNRAFLADLFTPLLDKMTLQELSNLAWDVYNADMKDTTSLKQFQNALNLYRSLCLRLIESGDTSQAWISEWTKPKSGSVAVETTICLLWLGDEFCNNVFANLILNSCKPGVIISKIIQSANIVELACSSPHAKDFLCAVLERRLAGNNGTWQMSNVKVPGYPRVESFLRSSEKTMTYANFENKEEASDFVQMLKSLGSDNGYILKAEVKGAKFNVSCLIEKSKEKKSAVEKREFEQALASIKSRYESSAMQADWEIASNPAKKKRVN